MNETKSFIPKKLDQVNWQLVLKFGLSFGLLGWVFSKIPFNTLVDNLRHCSLPCILLAFFMANLCMLVSACKWQPLLKVQDIKIPFWRLLAYYYAGLFANNFLPSSIGGDALRIYDVGRESGKIKEAAASVVLERLLASLALGLTAALAMLFMSQQTNSRLVYGAVAALVTICLVLTGFILIYPFKGEGKLGRWLYQMGHYRKYPGILLLVLLMSFVFQGCLVLCNVFTFQAVGIDLPIYVHFLYVPVIMAVSMIPLSINGLGVREGMYTLLYGYVGVAPSAALLCSLLFFTQVTLTSLAGGIIILLRNSGGKYDRTMSRDSEKDRTVF